jgi:hypothetical protein
MTSSSTFNIAGKAASATAIALNSANQTGDRHQQRQLDDQRG